MELRVIDFGRVSAIRSQSLWHAIAYGVSHGAPPTLSFMTPESPYVSIGLHSDIDAVDTDACERAGLPVFRRMVGGGPVYLDSDQLFFQITIPASMAPAMRPLAVRQLLTPAVDAFKQIGVDARLDDTNEIVVGDRKICGHAAGQVGDAVIVVGNLITNFDHEAAASIARTPNHAASGMFRQMLERYVTAVDADPETFKRAANVAYTKSLSPLREGPRTRFTSSLQGGQASEASQGGPRAREPGTESTLARLTQYELTRLIDMDRKLADPSFVHGEQRPRGAPWRVKIKSGVFVYGNRNEEATAVIGLVDDVITEACVATDGDAAEIERELVGSGLRDAADRLRRQGEAGAAVAQLVEAMA